MTKVYSCTSESPDIIQPNSTQASHAAPISEEVAKAKRPVRKEAPKSFIRQTGKALSKFFSSFGEALSKPFKAVATFFSSYQYPLPFLANFLFAILELAGVLFLFSYPTAVKILYPSPEYNVYIGVSAALGAVLLFHFIYILFAHRKHLRTKFRWFLIAFFIIGVIALIVFCSGWFAHKNTKWIWAYFAVAFALAMALTGIASSVNLGSKGIMSAILSDIFGITILCLALFTIIGGWLYVKKNLNDGVVDGYYYTIRDDGTLSVCLHDYDGIEDLQVPSDLLGRPVTVFACPAVSGGASLTHVTFTDSVLEIGEKSFLNCTSLVSVEMTDSVLSVGKSAFENCASLTTVKFSQSVTSLSDALFKDCLSLAEANISPAVEKIGKGCFQNCIALKEISIPESVRTIQKNAFRGCANLNVFSFPEGSSWYHGDKKEVKFSWGSEQTLIRRVLAYDGTSVDRS